MTDPIVVETTGATRIITLSRPQTRNALTRPMLALASEAFRDASVDPSVRCVVLAGAGGHFCSGADLRAAFGDDPEFLRRIDAYLDDFHALIKSIVHCARPIVAAMDGAAVGFGADLAFSCDLRIASRGAYAQEKFVEIGLMPDGGGTFWLPRLIGTARAMQAILLSERLDAAKLHELGIVAQLVDTDSARDAAVALARRLERGPPLAYAAIKRSVYASLGDIEGALRREREEQLRLLQSADASEGIQAWLEKREPRFSGR